MKTSILRVGPSRMRGRAPLLDKIVRRTKIVYQAPSILTAIRKFVSRLYATIIDKEADSEAKKPEMLPKKQK